ncbi:mannose-6-phosphate isomerase, class I [Nonomuraea africana]|uniref:mannose-6-phosphate isomerase n=1 Tax=Nonomuraea africana TaxID=46171 RepID=A0ABR9KFL4_9ACTN|nr:mannose-6-phosphate isomerase, class I [Nonomuraea africana]MBE1560774.1 mannose-6-phosphate isomerase [Nonomuraea africana]
MTELLSNPVKHYDWGSHTALATLTGRPSPSPEPEAEMWLGAHPSGPSVLVERGGRTLDAAIADDPEGELGAETVTRFGARLPYLLKLIAVDRVLSLQVHPSAEQAEAGHARGAYVDAYPKPELICALTPFSGLAGFREPGAAARLLAELEVPELEPVVARLLAADTAGALRLLLEWPERKALVEAVAAAAGRLGHDLVTRLAEQYPDDPAVLAPLLMNRHDLRPGEALFLGAGVLHCYLSGFGVEIMGGSDNVLRAGLTSKPIDVDELLRVTDPSTQPLRVEAVDGLYRVPVPEFALGRLEAPDTRLEGGLPRVLVCTEGEVTVDGRLLRAGESAFSRGSADGVEVRGPGTIFWAQPSRVADVPGSGA